MKSRILLVILLTSVLSSAQNYILEENISYRTESEIKGDEYIKERCVLDIYYPEDIAGFPTVVWFHGGGLRGGSKFIPSQLKEKGVAVIAVNYRLFPKIKSPVYIDDAAAAVAWTIKNISKYGGDSLKVFVSGHSAGGYLASMIGLDKSWLKKYGVDANIIAGLIPFSGHTITHFTVREEMGIPGEQPIVDKLAPLYFVKKEAPPYIIITGDRNLELLGRYEENLYMWRMMKVAGHENTQIYELQGYNHGEMVNPAYKILLNSVNKTLNK